MATRLNKIINAQGPIPGDTLTGTFIATANKLHGSKYQVWVFAEAQAVTVALRQTLAEQGIDDAYPAFTGGAVAADTWFVEELASLPIGQLEIDITSGATAPTGLLVVLLAVEGGG